MTSAHALPSFKSEWDRRVRAKNMQDCSIHTVKLRSASLIQEDQFLALRVLWKYHPNRELNLNKFDLKPWISKAQEILDQYKSWEFYLNSAATDIANMPESTFVMARYWQLMAAQTSSNQFNPSVAFSPKVHNTRSRSGNQPPKKDDPETPSKSTGTVPVLSSDTPEQKQPEEDSPGPEELLDMLYTPTKDEEIVTSALSNFLCGLIVHTNIRNRWTVHRRPFKAQFQHSSFEARVDGYLEDKSQDEKVRALVEVKPLLRQKQIVNICMQESAKMVAWIKNDPDEDGYLNKPGRRLHVSQDRHEIYITFAEYDDDFIQYLNDENYTNPNLPFLTMHQHGPWKTNVPAHMRELGKILLAVNLRAQSDMQKEAAEGDNGKDEQNKDEQKKDEPDDEEMNKDSDSSEDEEIDDGEDEEMYEVEGEDNEEEDTDSNDELATEEVSTRKSASGVRP